MYSFDMEPFPEGLSDIVWGYKTGCLLYDSPFLQFKEDREKMEQAIILQLLKMEYMNMEPSKYWLFRDRGSFYIPFQTDKYKNWVRVSKYCGTLRRQ